MEPLTKHYGRKFKTNDRNERIYNLYLCGKPVASLAMEFGISIQRVYQICRQERSKNLEDRVESLECTVACLRDEINRIRDDVSVRERARVVLHA